MSDSVTCLLLVVLKIGIEFSLEKPKGGVQFVECKEGQTSVSVQLSHTACGWLYVYKPPLIYIEIFTYVYI